MLLELSCDQSSDVLVATKQIFKSRCLSDPEDLNTTELAQLACWQAGRETVITSCVSIFHKPLFMGKVNLQKEDMTKELLVILYKLKSSEVTVRL